MAIVAEIRDFYTRPAPMTAIGAHADAVADLPHNIDALCRTVQGLLVHEQWAGAYGLTLPDARRSEPQLRPVNEMISRILALDGSRLTQARPVERRLVGVCRHFTLLTAAVLRAQGVPARARVGFGTYFTSGRFEDHWVVEYWNHDGGRWMLADSQIDDVQKKAIKPDFDLLDVPRDRFVVAGDAWRQWRAGKVSSKDFGIFDMRGAWFIAGNVVRDFAALNNMEMLPWDVWEPMVRDDASLDPKTLERFDRLAELTCDVDNRFGALRALYETDAQWRVPPVVFNAVLNRPDRV